jgi:hypothetical protein
VSSMQRATWLSLALEIAAASVCAAETSLSVSCAAGDAVCGGALPGPGFTFLMSAPQSSFNSLQWPNQNGATLHVFPPAGGYFTSWYIEFKAPGEGPLVPGFYANATRSFFYYVTLPNPGMWIASNSGCNAVTGEFEILQIAFDPNNNLRKLWARFKQRCVNFSAGLVGEVRFNVEPQEIPQLSANGRWVLVLAFAVLGVASLASRSHAAKRNRRG